MIKVTNLDLARQLVQAVKEQQEAGAKYQETNKKVDELKTAIAQEAINELESTESTEVAETDVAVV